MGQIRNSFKYDTQERYTLVRSARGLREILPPL